MTSSVLVCFAVEHEAKPFRKLARGRPDVSIVLTGIGRGNAQRAFADVLERTRPAAVITSGFAGALDPDLKIGDVVFRGSDQTPTAHQCRTLGFTPVVFVCADRIAVTRAEKAALRSTGADAVEMESEAIAALCRDAQIPCSTLRAISDTAEEDLPLDFNALMTPESQLSGSRLGLAIARAPHKIPALIRLGRNSACAARQLAHALVRII